MTWSSWRWCPPGGGLVEGFGPIFLTPAGQRELGPYEPLPTGPALLDHWRRDLGGLAAEILSALAAAHPRTLSRAALANRVGKEAAGGYFGNTLGRLRTLGLVVGRGELGLAEELR